MPCHLISPGPTSGTAIQGTDRQTVRSGPERWQTSRPASVNRGTRPAGHRTYRRRRRAHTQGPARATAPRAFRPSSGAARQGFRRPAGDNRQATPAVLRPLPHPSGTSPRYRPGNRPADRFRPQVPAHNSSRILTKPHPAGKHQIPSPRYVIRNLLLTCEFEIRIPQPHRARPVFSRRSQANGILCV